VGKVIDAAFKDYVPTVAEGSQAYVDGVYLKDNPYTGAQDKVKAKWWARGWRATRDLSTERRGKA
jgi:hypothetical protein